MAATPVILPGITIPPSSQPLPMYPISPISQFPPLPPSRRALRDRRGVPISLSITTSFSHNAHDSGAWSQKGHLQPHRNNLPRRRKGAKKRVIFYDEEPEPKAEAKHEGLLAPITPPLPIAQARPEPAIPAPNAKEICLQELVPALWVAFSSPSTELPTQDGAYTHIVQICHPSASQPANACEEAYDGDAQRLRLTLPADAQGHTQRAGLALTDAQLRAARDFLAQALPYSNMPVAQGEPAGVRVAVVTPYGRPTDAMCVVGCYLAFVSGKSADAVLRFVDEEEEFLSAWKGEVSEDEVAQVEKVARAWSWLSSVVRS